ncbi:uncharacterized protein HD556DRAFT_915981 [Suillus plorans]|uniref:Uncharacterized protein n=1 Tax=Suillus plorans TaxID=116603 RepID=A0A9P7DDL3_9AGAM|nr:uncharacterized protein HD556DRAFT_915981 [Suillus plorans]KAG1788142.1 hypothetical protein HD556DRAFT_915981 [Suillus plorans]
MARLAMLWLLKEFSSTLEAYIFPKITVSLAKSSLFKNLTDFLMLPMFLSGVKLLAGLSHLCSVCDRRCHGSFSSLKLTHTGHRNKNNQLPMWHDVFDEFKLHLFSGRSLSMSYRIMNRIILLAAAALSNFEISSYRDSISRQAIFLLNLIQHLCPSPLPISTTIVSSSGQW